jgi:hypothetical protein
MLNGYLVRYGWGPMVNYAHLMSISCMIISETLKNAPKKPVFPGFLGAE